MTWKGEDRFFQGDKRADSERAYELVHLAVMEAEAQRRAAKPNTRALRANYQTVFEVTVEAVILDLLLCHLDPVSHNDSLAVSRDLGILGTADDLKSEALNTTLPDRLDNLEAAGWLRQEIGGRSPSSGARLTRIYPGSRLIESAQRLGLTIADVTEVEVWTPVVIRDANKQDLKGSARRALLSTPAGCSILRDLQEINAFMRSLPLVQITDGVAEPIRGQQLFRVFNNARLDHGGRFQGGIWIDMSNEERLNCLRLNGKALVKLDFKSMQPRIAYALAGETPLTEDIYTLRSIKGVPREAIKTIMVAMFWGTKPRTRMPHGVRPMVPRQIAFGDIRVAIYKDHPALTEYLEKCRGAELMYHESQILNRILLKAAERKLPVLPVHDAVYCPLGREEETRALMEAAFREHTGGEGIVEIEYGPLKENSGDTLCLTSGVIEGEVISVCHHHLSQTLQANSE